MLQKFTQKLLCFALFMFVLHTTGLYAQGNEAIVSGTIIADKNQTIPGAVVKVRNESTGFSTTTMSNEKGDYIFKQLPLGDNYTITVISNAFGEQVKSGYKLNQGDQLVVNFEYVARTAEIAAVEIRGNSLRKSIKTLGASTSVSAQDLEKLPVNGRNFTSLIDLSPLSSGNNLMGQLKTSTNYQIDGMTSRNPLNGGGPTAGAYSISMEAIREFQVITNAYDVTYGRAGGGIISTVTKAGTNTFKGAAFLYNRADWLSSKYDIRGEERDVPFSTQQYGFSLGGPIIIDRLHFFVAWDHQRDRKPLNILDMRSVADEQRNSITQESLDRFLSIGRSKYGLSDEAQTGNFDKPKGTDAAFARLDWQLNARNLLTIRNNFVYENSKYAEGDNTTHGLLESYVDRVNYTNSLLATLRTVLGPNLTNEAKFQHMYYRADVLNSSFLPQTGSIPRAIVEGIKSTSEDGTEYTTNIQFGGHRFSPESFTNNVYQFVDNVYYNKGRFNFTFGVDFLYTRYKSLYGSEMNGRFYFTGLDNFDNLQPYRYAREIYLNDDPVIRQQSLGAGIYGQVETKLAKGLDMMAGLRLDYTNYMTKANFNETVFKTLDLRTDNNLDNFQIQPRVQFTWDVQEKRTDVLKLGAGIFGSDINNYNMINNLLFDGTKVASVDIQGAQVPKPNFPGYRNDPNSDPGKDLLNNPNIDVMTTINLNGADVKVPTLYKMNFSYNKFFSDRFRLGLSLYASWARNNYMYVDRNMVDDPFFTIDAEGGRGVYVPAGSINTSNGATDWTKGRKTTEVGRVLELISEGKVNQKALVVDGTYRYFKDGQLSFSYTLNDTRDNTSYNGDVANSATLSLMVQDDPRDLSRMTYSDNQFRHKVVLYGNAPSFWGITVGVRYSGIAGARYSLVVSGSVNGDFVSSNDLAYIYDPNDPNTPEYIREGMNDILNNPEVAQSMKDYLSNNFGKIAERNGGIKPFYGTWDLRLAKKVNVYKKHGIELSVDVFNVMNMLSKDWGVDKSIGKTNLFTVKSFDPISKTYTYGLNKNAGISGLGGTPFQVQVGARFSF